MKRDVISAGEVLTKELLNQLNDDAWKPIGVKGQLIVLKRVHFSFLNPSEKTIISIPSSGLKNWTVSKFKEKFNKTMNAMCYDIKFQ